ncbi:MAG: citrate/2-methylcitrate synthase, partial [Vicinamibacterales bacterium]
MQEIGRTPVVVGLRDWRARRIRPIDVTAYKIVRMAAPDAKAKGGLEDVVATSSAICWLDGDRGILAYCGYDIHDLARFATFEEVCYLLWHRRLPTRAELGDLQSQFAAARALPEPVLRLMRMLPPSDGMDALRTLTSALAHYDREAADTSPQAQYRKAV